jgi:anthranilate phosphoribosyltransferase
MIKSAFLNHPSNKILAEILKGKGVGPEGSKNLNLEQLEKLTPVMIDPTASLITKATLLTAFWMLDNTPEEQNWLENFKNSPEFCEELKPLLGASFVNPFWDLVLKVIHKEDLDTQECIEAVTYMTYANQEGFLSAMFLEAERLKRETFSENLTFLNALQALSEPQKVKLPFLIDLCDPYDGQNRTPCLLPFVASVLAAAGYPTVIHGVEQMPPKCGITAHQVLKLAHKNPFRSSKQAQSDIENPNISWTYIDQSQSFSLLWDLKSVREEMVKRPFLATFEKLMQPLQAQKNHLVTGYTHKNYRTMLTDVLQHCPTISSATVIRGVEGSSRPSLARESLNSIWTGTEVVNSLFSPEAFGLRSQVELLDKEFTAQESLDLGLSALKNQNIDISEAICYWAASALVGAGFCKASESKETMNLCRSQIESGRALLFFKQLDSD